MFDFIAHFSHRLQAALSALKEAQDIFVAVEDLIHDQAGRNPKAQSVLNDIHALQKKLVRIGEQ
jgi:hypothetical protein